MASHRRARALTAARYTRHAIRSTLGGLLMIALVAIVGAGLITVGPRSASGILAADLRHRMGTASAYTLDLQNSIDPLSPFFFGDPTAQTQTSVAAVKDALPRIRKSMPAALRAVTDPGRYVVRSEGNAGSGIPASGPPNGPPSRTLTLSLEGDPELRTDTRLVSGTWPTSVPRESTAPIPVVVSDATAKELVWHLGEVQQLSTTFGDQRGIVLVGTVAPRDPHADFWQLDPSRAKAGYFLNQDYSISKYHGVAWLDEGSWADEGLQLGGASVRSWFPIDGDAIAPSAASAVNLAASRFIATPQTVQTGDDAPLTLRFHSDLRTVIAAYADSAAAASSVLSVVEAGPLAIGVALLLLAVSLLAHRRARDVRLAVGRGASRGQVRREFALQVGLFSVPAAAIGVTIGAAISPGGVQPSLIAVGVVFAAMPVAFGALVIAPGAWNDGSGGLTRRARLVVDGILVLIAALTVVLLVQRGLAGGTTDLGPDPLLTATPIVLSAAGCALALRLLPGVFRVIRHVVRRERGAVGLIGQANSVQVGSRFLPTFATVTGIAIALFASLILATQQHGLVDAARGTFGADIRISNGPVSEADLSRLRALPGLAHLAVIDVVPDVQVAGHSQNFAAYRVNAADLAAVESDISPQKRPFPDLGAHRDGRPVAYGGGFIGTLHPTSTLTRSIRMPVTAISMADPPEFVSASPWMLVDSRSIPTGQKPISSQSSVLIRADEGADEATLVHEIRAVVGPGQHIDSAASQVRALSSSPLVPGLTILTLIAIAASLLLAVATLLLALIMNAANRTVLLARLRALGFARDQAVGVISWELGPMVLMGAVVGALIGIVTGILFLFVVDLTTFVGGTSAPALSIDPRLAIGSVLAFLVCAAVAAVLTAVLATRSRPARRIRELDPS